MSTTAPLATGTLIEVKLENGEHSRATVIDFISKSDSYRVSFDDFSVMTVPSKNVVKLADNPCMAPPSALAIGTLESKQEPNPERARPMGAVPVSDCVFLEMGVCL